MTSIKHKITRKGNKILFNEQIDILELAENSRFCVKSVSEEVGLTLMQFETLMVKSLEINPKELFSKHRAVMARRLIMQGTDRKTIIELLGFKYDSHYCYEIKRHYGLSPNKLAKQLTSTKTNSASPETK